MLQPLREQEDAFGRQLLDYVDGEVGEARLERAGGAACVRIRQGACSRRWLRRRPPQPRGERRGHDVVAIDVSPGAVEVCRRRGVRDARLLSLATVDWTLGGQVTLRLRYQGRVMPWFELLNAAPDELPHVLGGTGWSVAHVLPTDSAEYFGVLKKTRTC